jgi:hypothetical protein
VHGALEGKGRRREKGKRRPGSAAGAGKKGGGRLEVDDGADGWAPVVGEREREEGEVGRRGRLGRAGSETGRC